VNGWSKGDRVWSEYSDLANSTTVGRPNRDGIDNDQMPSFDPFRFVLISVAGWMNQRQRQMIGYLREENRVLREQLGSRRLRLSDDQGRRLAVKARGIGRKFLADVVTIVTPETLLPWHSRLMSQK
jgi:hypothetical protein